MGIREAINKRQGLTSGVVAGVIVAAIAVGIWSTRSPVKRLTTAFYSDESGSNVFSDDVDRIYPFDHSGKPAYRAYVYHDQDGKEFVAYIARYNEATRARLQGLVDQQSSSAASELAFARGTGIEVKKPGNDKWVPIDSAEGGAIAGHPKLPDGSVAQAVSP